MKQSIKYIKILTNIGIAGISIFLFMYIAPKMVVLFMPFVIGWIIALIANPLVRFLERKLKIVRKHGSMLIIIVVLAGIILGVYFGGAKLIEESMNVIEGIPKMYASLQEDINDVSQNLSGIYNKLPENIQKTISAFNSNFSSYVGNMVQAIGAPTVTAAGRFAKNVPSTLIAIIMTILSSYFLIDQREKIALSYRMHVPLVIQEKIDFIVNDFKKVVGGYFKAQFKIMSVVFVMVLVGLLVLRVNYAILLAILISFLDMLPFFGTGTVLVPWAIFNFLSADYGFAIGLVVLYGATQLVRQLIQPKILGDTIGLNPLLALVFMYIGYKFSSVIGMIVAVPIGMIIINLFKAGVFDNLIYSIKELIHDINEFRSFKK